MKIEDVIVDIGNRKAGDGDKFFIFSGGEKEILLAPDTEKVLRSAKELHAAQRGLYVDLDMGSYRAVARLYPRHKGMLMATLIEAAARAKDILRAYYGGKPTVQAMYRLHGTHMWVMLSPSSVSAADVCSVVQAYVTVSVGGAKPCKNRALEAA